MGDKETAALINQIILIMTLTIVISGVMTLVSITSNYKDKALAEFEAKDVLREQEHWKQYTRENVSGAQLLTMTQKVLYADLAVVITRPTNNLMLGKVIDNLAPNRGFYTARQAINPSPGVVHLGDNIGLLREPSNPNYINLKHLYSAYPIYDVNEPDLIIGVIFILRY